MVDEVDEVQQNAGHLFCGGNLLREKLSQDFMNKFVSLHMQSLY